MRGLGSVLAHPNGLIKVVRRALKRSVNTAKQVLNARHAVGQYIPLQTLNRTLFEYDVTFFGSGDVYLPKETKIADAPLMSLTLLPQAFAAPYHFFVENAVVTDDTAIDPAAPRRQFVELMPNVVPSQEGKTWTYDLSKRKRAVRRAAKSTHVLGSAYIFSSANWSNYYHFLLDAGVRYANLEAAGAIRNDMIPLAHSAPNTWQSAYLELLGIDTDKIKILPKDSAAPLRVSSLLIGSAARSRFAVSPMAARRFRDRILAAAEVTDPRPTRRLYISRSDASKRRLLNEAEIWPLLEEAGFEFTKLEGMDVASQIRLFSSASVIAAPHGAGLTNMIFSNAPTVLEILPVDRWNFGVFSTLTNVMGGTYHGLIAQPERRPKVHIRSETEDNDYGVDPKRLARLLEMVVSRP